jgi:type VII secretion effector (TIGR04197 family)
VNKDMSKVGINQSQWDSVVSQGAGAVSSISPAKPKQISKTTLNRFKKFSVVVANIQKVLTSYKSASQMETNKMTSVGQKIVDEDKQAAVQLNQNTGKMRAIK